MEHNPKQQTKMKAITRTFLKIDETLHFKKENNFIIEKYFKPEIFADQKNDVFKLWIDYATGKIANTLDINLVYYDFSKSIKKYESFEYNESIKISLPKDGILKRNEISKIIKKSSETMLLWKIIFKINPLIDSEIHISVD